MDFEVNPKCMTVLCTYQCTAACKQCCFESNPRIKGGLEGEQIRLRISEAKKEFTALNIVVFTGGEAFLLKEELIKCVAHATSLGLKTRIVSNGFWAKRADKAKQICSDLKLAGLGELNISTGRDHQEFVPEQSVLNACEAAILNDITTLITVETDTGESDCFNSLADNERIKKLYKDKRFKLINNVWMSFHSDAEERKQIATANNLETGCSQVFDNIVITPHDNVSACCGLTLEHIPEMRLGKNNGSNMSALYGAQSDDFMKYWIQVDGPYSIIKKVMGDDHTKYLDGVVHPCQACAILHKSPEIRDRIRETYTDYVNEVMTRFSLVNAVQNIQNSNIRELVK